MITFLLALALLAAGCFTYGKLIERVFSVVLLVMVGVNFAAGPA